MIKVEDGKLQAELLDNRGTLSDKIIQQYDYIELKNDFAEIVDILSTNMLVHAMYEEALKYEPGDILPVFIFFVDEREVHRMVGEHSKEEILNVIDGIDS